MTVKRGTVEEASYQQAFAGCLKRLASTIFGIYLDSDIEALQADKESLEVNQMQEEEIHGRTSLPQEKMVGVL